jgi:WD40 repeat protein
MLYPCLQWEQVLECCLAEIINPLTHQPLSTQVYYLDTFKFFLSLYGHKLPVLCMDISSDSTLLISGSADKNIKVSSAQARAGSLHPPALQPS